VLDAPTGTGKSLVDIAFGTSQAMRFAYLTANRALQDQVMDQHGDIGLVDVRGMDNYPCYEMPPKPQNTCARGPCLDGFACPLMFGGCSYFDRVRDARKADRINTNYSMWMTSEGLGQRDLLILDEAHEAAEQVGNHLRLRFDTVQDNVVLPPRQKAEGWDIRHWTVWAESQLEPSKRELADAPPGTGEHRRLKELVRRLELLLQATGDWVWEFGEDWLSVQLEPVWPAPYVEQLLFRGVSKLLLSSATIRPSHMKYLGLKEGQYEFISALSPFAAWRRPITWIPTVALSKETEQAPLEKWLSRIDEIFESRMQWKGIIHPHSYHLAKFIKAASRHRRHILLPNRLTTRSVVEQFKAMKPPAVLLSPAVRQGFDFSYDQARWQIIAKMPFPPVKSSPILQRRVDEDPAYQDHLTADALVQTAGRVVRAEDDLGETFIIDDNWDWFRKKHERVLFSGWFREALRTERTVPAPPAYS
jgi:Rad3-related DNA helicase